MSKHTPGPWTVGDANGYRATSVLAGDNSVADVYGLPRHRHISQFVECEGLANARLIAAAPDLLEALEWISKHYANQHINHQDFRVEAYAKALAAIARATGAA